MNPAIFVIDICILVFIYTVIFQVIVPLYKGEKMFPIFNPSQQMEGDLANAKEKTAQRSIREEIKQEKSNKQTGENGEK